MNDVDAIDDAMDASLVVKVKQEPFDPVGVVVFICCAYFVFCYTLFNSSLFLGFCMFSDVVESVDKGFTESTFLTAPISPVQLDP